MGNRVVARKIQTPDGVVVLVADDYAKTYLEYDTDPGSQTLWQDVLQTEEFEDIAGDCFTDNSGTIMLDASGQPMSNERTFILEDLVL